jgi:hypothetical protein
VLRWDSTSVRSKKVGKAILPPLLIFFVTLLTVKAIICDVHHRIALGIGAARISTLRG